jgi:O-antigen biosynthesis protein
LISVLVPAFGPEADVIAAIESALAQTYPNLEVVIACDAPPEATVAPIRERYPAEPRVRWIRGEPRERTATGPMALAFGAARGEFVLWLPPRDRLLPAHLARLHEAFVREPSLDVVYTGAYLCDEQGRIEAMLRIPSRLLVDEVDARDEVVEMLTIGCALRPAATLVRRSLVAELGLPNPGTGGAAAMWEFAVRLAAAGKRFAYLAVPSVCLRASADAPSPADLVAILERHIDGPARERLHGYETNVVALLDGLAANAPPDAELDARIDALRRKLEERARTREPVRVREQRISIIVPVNLPGPVFGALDSIVAQTYANWEVCLIDQGVFPLENAFRGHPAWGRLSVLRLPYLMVPGAARNHGLRMIRGEYVAYLDEDNRFGPDHLESLIATIERTGSDAAVASAKLVVERADVRFVDPQRLAVATHVFREPGDPPELGRIANATPLNAVLHHRRTLARTQTFSPTLPILEDFEFLMRLEAVAPFAFSERATLECCVRAGLIGQALGTRLKVYPEALSAVYAAHPVARDVARQRSLHAAAVGSVLAGADELEPPGLPDFIATLAGRTVFPARGTG